jgi:putative restriction endonuclease
MAATSKQPKIYTGASLNLKRQWNRQFAFWYAPRMNLRDEYSKHITGQNVQGSNKASSYIRALELLDGILEKVGLFGHNGFWSIESVDDIGKLQFQKKEDSEFLRPKLPPSYGRNGYYSAALKSYQEFLILRQYEAGLWELYNTPGMDPVELGKRLDRKKIKSIEALVSDRDIDFSTKEGKEVLRQTKARVNQKFFREMILADYGEQCCVTGLNVPEVLRASHIVGWAESKENRMNPTNGLCLSATYDAAFDRHLISFDENYRMILSPALKEHYSNSAFKTQFLALRGRKISLPARYRPDLEFLEQHREKLVA